MGDDKSSPKQIEMFQAKTTWFHVFNAMVESGDVAKIGPHALTVYLIVKSYTNWKSGVSFPAVETIAEKSGMSQRQVLRCLPVLVEHGYLEKQKVGRRNVYTLREKVQFADGEGRPSAVATWDYLPSAVEAARAELKKFMVSGEVGQIVNIETLNLNIQMIGQAETVKQKIVNDSGAQVDLSPRTAKALREMKAAMDAGNKKKRENKD